MMLRNCWKVSNIVVQPMTNLMTIHYPRLIGMLIDLEMSWWGQSLGKDLCGQVRQGGGKGSELIDIVALT